MQFRRAQRRQATPFGPLRSDVRVGQRIVRA